MRIITDIQQGTPEWLELRRGIPTASRFRDIMSKGKRQKYLYQLVGERLTGEPMDTFINYHMRRGNEREAEARADYEFHLSQDVQEVTFVINGRVGCSPDGLVGDNGLWENKDALAHIQVERLLKHELPTEHVAQVQGQIWVCERDWCDFQSYCRGMNAMIIRVPRDDAYIKTLSSAVDSFCDELDELTERLSDHEDT